MNSSPQIDTSPFESVAEPSTSKRRHRGYTRSFKACDRCRTKKTRCILDKPEEPQAACQRCKRERQLCSLTNQSVSPDVSHDRTSYEERQTIQHNQHNVPLPNYSSLSAPTAESDRGGGVALIASSGSMQPPLHRLPDFHLMLPLTTRATDNIDNVVHAPISNDGDTIKLLQQSSKYEDAQDGAQRDNSSALPGASRHGPWTMNGPFISDLSSPSIEALRLWNSLRFVRMGWLTATEAVSYMDLFFKNILPLSPVMDDFYSHHDNHYTLITQEPLLCCTILMISSRFHYLQGASSWSRSVALHTRLWDHCEHLIGRIILGQEKKSKAKTRTLGSIQALILMTEWAPRSVYFPPKSDGWDSDLLFQLPDNRDQLAGNLADVTQDLQGNWYRDVVAPAKTIDRMSWMLLGCAVTLGHEIGLFTTTAMNSAPNDTQHHQTNRIWLRKVIYIADEQLSSRKGLTSMIPTSLNSSAFEPCVASADTEQTHKFINGQLALAELARSISNTLFSSRNITQELIQSYKYVSSIEEYQQKLAAWREVHLDKQGLLWHTYDLLEIEYQYATVFLHSLGMQAVVDRSCRSNPNDAQTASRATINFATPTDLRFIDAVVQGSCKLMQSAIHIAEHGCLQYCPTRTIARIIGVSVFLLKALGLGIERAVFNNSLDQLENMVRIIRYSIWDDLDLAKRYADILHHHIYQLKNSSTRGSHQETPTVDQRPGVPLADRGTSYENSDVFGSIHVDDDWPNSLAFLDASLAPFGITTDESSGLTGLGDNDWSLLWNIPSFYTPSFPP